MVAVRDERESVRAIEAITAVSPDAQLTPVPLDLGKLESVRALLRPSSRRCPVSTCWS